MVTVLVCRGVARVGQTKADSRKRSTVHDRVDPKSGRRFDHRVAQASIPGAGGEQ
jgi:hypothetical protein